MRRLTGIGAFARPRIKASGIRRRNANSFARLYAKRLALARAAKRADNAKLKDLTEAERTAREARPSFLRGLVGRGAAPFKLPKIAIEAGY